MLRKRDYIVWWVKYVNSLRYFTKDDRKSYANNTSDCSLDKLRYVYGKTINLYAKLQNLDPIVKGYDPFVDSESENDSVSEDEDKLFEEEAMCEKDNVNKKVSRSEESKEENLKTEGVVAEEEETLATVLKKKDTKSSVPSIPLVYEEMEKNVFYPQFLHNQRKQR